MIRSLRALFLPLLLLPPAGAVAQEKKSDKPEPAKPRAPGPSRLVVPLAPAAPAERALRYPLLPDALDRTPGNAAPLWMLAALTAHEEQGKLKPDEFRWFFNPDADAPDTLPKKEARELLARFAPSLRLADQAARRSRCDWERPPLTLKNVNDVIQLVQIQHCRLVARLLSLRARLELSEKQFDKASYSMQSGLALARDLASGGTIIDDLVGNAIAAVFFAQIDEWVQTPGSPDLYWELTALPSPFFDLRATVAYELNTVYRSYPSFRHLNNRHSSDRPTNEEIERLAKELTSGSGKGDSGAAVAASLLSSAFVFGSQEEAKKYLLSQGWAEEEVKAATPLTVALTYFFGQYDRARDEVLGWMTVPAWQGQDELAKATKRIAESAGVSRNLLILQLFPAVERVYQAWLRTERKISTLRAAEALRMYAAAHDGKAPAKLSDVTAVPLPVDPATGKGFDDNYAVREGKAVLEVTPRFWVWRYEMPAGK
jgi:hypothetical protein